MPPDDVVAPVEAPVDAAPPPTSPPEPPPAPPPELPPDDPAWAQAAPAMRQPVMRTVGRVRWRIGSSLSSGRKRQLQAASRVSVLPLPNGEAHGPGRIEHLTDARRQALLGQK